MSTRDAATQTNGTPNVATQTDRPITDGYQAMIAAQSSNPWDLNQARAVQSHTIEDLDGETTISELEDYDPSNEDDQSPEISHNPWCQAVPRCVTACNDKRKVISHIFGRNKAPTASLPRDSWILWCRQHYQRFKFRANNTGTWHLSQLQLVREQLDAFESSGLIRAWTVDVTEKVKMAIKAGPCWETFLSAHVGNEKTFAQIRDILADIEHHFEDAEFAQRENKAKMFPEIRFVPVVTPPGLPVPQACLPSEVRGLGRN